MHAGSDPAHATVNPTSLSASASRAVAYGARAMLKRLPLFFAALTVGLVFAGWLSTQLLAGRVMEKDTEPVRRRLVADWEQHADALAADLAATKAWSELDARTPPNAGCQLRWMGDSAALERHLARCDAALTPLDEATLSALEALGDQLLARAAEAPTVSRDLTWLRALRGHGDWSQAAGTPLEFVDPSLARSAHFTLPQVEPAQTRGLAQLRLLEGQRAGALDEAVLDVTALARALLGRPLAVDQLLGADLLLHLRAALDAAGRPELGPPAPELASLQRARLASAMLWHPWVPRAQRDRFLPVLHAASRCAALGEALVVLETGPLLAEHYADFALELGTWHQAAPCRSDFLARMVAARRELPERSWRRLLPMAELVQRAELGDLLPGILLWAAESSAAGRHALLELIFSVTVARPFAVNTSS